ncbi:MAG: flagellar biosynthesis anti-sigma factor FlgM [Lachnospiraceae bacterium]|nr:flagellar biosynthesis anti-sigma factor FlgM [Lachnospiraceae bacterium]
MRIEAYTQLQQLYSTKKTARAESVKKPSFADAVQISSLGKDIQVAKQAVASSPDVREDLVAPLKAQIQAGTYNVSGEQLANKLLAQAGSIF